MLKRLFLYSTLILSALAILGVPLLAGAIDTGYKIITTIPGSDVVIKDKPASGISLQEYIRQIYIFALAIVGLIALAAIVIWAFKYIISAGNPSKMRDAMEGIRDAVLGLILLLLAATILGFINPNLLRLRPFDNIIKPIPGGSSNSDPTSGGQIGGNRQPCLANNTCIEGSGLKCQVVRCVNPAVQGVLCVPPGGDSSCIVIETSGPPQSNSERCLENCKDGTCFEVSGRLFCTLDGETKPI